MIDYVNECVGCRDSGLPCMGSSCSQRRVPHYYCDECGKEEDALYECDGMELCFSCYERAIGKDDIEEEEE